MPVVYHCPHCRQPVTVPDAMLGQAIGCPHCRGAFQTAPAAPQPPVPPQPQPLSLDDGESAAAGDGFDTLDTESKGRVKPRPRPGGQKIPLSQRFGMVGGIVGGALVTAFYVNNQRPQKGFDFQQMLISGAVAGVCGALFFLIGKAIEGPSETGPRRYRRRDDDE